MNTTTLTNSNQVSALIAVTFAMVAEFLQNISVIRGEVQNGSVCFVAILK